MILFAYIGIGGSILKKKSLFLLVILLVIPSMANAYGFLGNKYQQPGSIYYYYDSSITNANGVNLSGYVNYGSNAWDKDSNVEVLGSSAHYIAKIRWSYSSTDNGYYGIAYPECYCYPNDYTKIVLYYDFRYNISNARMYETAVHEVGHALGLSHEDRVQAIMMQYDWLDSTVPASDDWNGVAARY